MAEGADTGQLVGIKRDLLTGTQQVIVDKDSMLAAVNTNLDALKILRDIRKLIAFSVPAIQYLVRSSNPTVTNASPVDITFRGQFDEEIATLIAISGSADFFYDFDKPASINSPEYNIASAQLGNTIWIANIQVQRLSILASTAGPFYINNFASPQASYISVRAWGAPYFIDDAHI